MINIIRIARSRSDSSNSYKKNCTEYNCVRRINGKRYFLDNFIDYFSFSSIDNSFEGTVFKVEGSPMDKGRILFFGVYFNSPFILCYI